MYPAQGKPVTSGEGGDCAPDREADHTGAI